MLSIGRACSHTFPQFLPLYCMIAMRCFLCSQLCVLRFPVVACLPTTHRDKDAAAAKLKVGRATPKEVISMFIIEAAASAARIIHLSCRNQSMPGPEGIRMEATVARTEVSAIPAKSQTTASQFMQGLQGAVPVDTDPHTLKTSPGTMT